MANLKNRFWESVHCTVCMRTGKHSVSATRSEQENSPDPQIDAKQEKFPDP